MALGQIKAAAWLEQRGDDLRPLRDIGKPVDGAPGHIDQIEITLEQ